MTKTKRNRSPNYPVVNLQGALPYLDKLYKFGQLHFVPMQAVFEEAWGMKKGSAYGKQVVAALKAFGLIDDAGSGDARKVKVSESGAKIRGDHSDRPKLLKEAALLPKVHNELWSEFGSTGDLPPKAAMRQYLLFDRQGNRFNESSVDEFIDEFVDTVVFAKLGKKDTDEALDTSNNENGPEDSDYEIQVGSFVQWTSQGEDQFPEPRKVTQINYNDGEGYAYIEEEGGYVPMSELTIAKKSEEVETPLHVLKPKNENRGLDSTPVQNTFGIDNPPSQGMRKEHTSLDDGVVILSMPEKLSPASVEDFHRWADDQKDRAYRRAGGQNKSVPLPSGGLLHLVSHPGSDKWQIKSYDFSWLAGMNLMTATVHAAANGWELLEFVTPEDAIRFVAEKPIPAIVPQD